MPLEPEALRPVSILRDLDDTELNSLAAIFYRKEYPAKTRIIEEGTSVTRFSIVLDGAIHVRRLAQKREMLMGQMGPGAFYGEINLFDPGLATATVVAMKPSQVAEVGYETFREFMASNPATGYKIVTAMMKEMSRRLRQTNSRLVATAYWASPQPGS